MKYSILALFMLLLSNYAVAGDPVRILSGGPATANLLKSKQADLEKAAGAKVEVNLTPVESGIKALAGGHVDGLVVGLPPEQFLSDSAKKGVEVGAIDQWQWTPMAEVTIKIAVPPSNPVEKLTAEQITDILNGKTTTWESINGKKDKITVYIPTAYTATAKIFLKHYTGKDTSAVVESVADKTGALRGLEKNPGALAVLGTPEKTDVFQPKYIETEAKIHSFLLMKKTGKAENQKLFDFVKTLPKAKL